MTSAGERIPRVARGEESAPLGPARTGCRDGAPSPGFVLNHGDIRAAERLAKSGAWSWDVEAGVIRCSPELRPVLGIDPPNGDHDAAFELSMDEWLATAVEQDRERMRSSAVDLLRTREGVKLIYRRGDRGARAWVEIYAAVAEEREDRVVRVAGLARDITERVLGQRRRRRFEQELIDQQRILELIARDEPLQLIMDELCRMVERRFRGASCSVLRVDRGGGVLRDVAGPSIPGSYRDALDGLPIGDGIGACGTAAARGEPVVVEDLRRDPLTERYEGEITAAGFESVWSHPLIRSGGEVVGTFAVYRSAPTRPSRREQSYVSRVGVLAALALERDSIGSMLHSLARYDSLTGLLNRSRFLELTNEELRGAGAPLAVMFFELDRFKQISDRSGHVATDRLLVLVGEQIRDTVGDLGIVARFGPDEFAVMLSDGARAGDLAEVLLQRFSEPFRLDGGELYLVPTIGIAHGDAGADAYGLVRDAAAAMHEARSEGIGRVHVYDGLIRARVIERVNRSAELRRAIEHGQLSMHYQPIFSLADGSVDHAEALVRWHHPQRGSIPPSKFIALAEETGLIIPLGHQVLQMAIAQARRWEQRLPGVRVSANVSPIQLTSPKFVETLESMLAAEGLPGSSLILEITESGLMQGVEVAHSAIIMLRELGVGVVVDDFGTGYSSLARLYELPITGLKIDRSFVRRIHADHSAHTVIHAVCEIARSHSFTVVAEGVEDAHALSAVEQAGCDFAQGYHLARPAPPEAAEALMTAKISAR